ncbi:MAG TPA: alpha-ketoglutarate-dependent dioxygenase AlkB [Polyangiales bacterium]|nr:alpha-ketoglutarate-dependent dioxygenase AlkB [Polyangiales bacterium]
MKWELPDDGLVELIPDFVPAERCATTFDALRAALPFEAKEIRILGRPVMQPRLTAWVGDEGAVYRYSGTLNVPQPWPEALLELRARVADVAGVAFNSVLCNLYRGGTDSMGMHSDSEPELGRNPIIASLSLGAVRRFQLRHRKQRGVGVDIDLPDGSLLIMRGALQHYYRHGVPKQPNVKGARLNLTFRRVAPSS